MDAGRAEKQKPGSAANVGQASDVFFFRAHPGEPRFNADFRRAK
jgi:hypothetical protein